MKAGVLVIILILIILIGFQTQKQTSPAITGSTVKELPEEKEEIICNSPYMRHAESCCLDKNFNDICDNDESAPEQPPQPQSPTTTEDSCIGTTYFDCWGSYITKNEIFLRLKARRDGYTILKRIEFPSINCEKEFELVPKEQGLEIRETIEISIPCKTSTTYFKDLTYNIESIYYPASGDTTEWLNKQRGSIISPGTLTGTVRDQPPEIK